MGPRLLQLLTCSLSLVRLLLVELLLLAIFELVVGPFHMALSILVHGRDLTLGLVQRLTLPHWIHGLLPHRVLLSLLLDYVLSELVHVVVGIFETLNSEGQVVVFYLIYV